jgi:hypothetical protein
VNNLIVVSPIADSPQLGESFSALSNNSQHCQIV